MRGIYNGEIKDRTNLIELLLLFAMLFLVAGFIFYSAYRFLFLTHDPARGIIFFGAGLLFSWLYLVFIGGGIIFLTISKEKIIIKRPFYRLSPFRKHRPIIEFSSGEIREINIMRPRKALMWRFISTEGKEMIKFNFEPEFITNTVELEDYFKENNINIRVSRQ